MKKVSNAKWANYKAILDNYSDSANQAVVTWLKYNRLLDVFNEDWDPKNYTSINLNCLVNYNYMRTWPITQHTDSGETDRQSEQIFLNKGYLKTIGHLNAHDNLDYNPDTDRFIMDGILYKGEGDTSAAQAGFNKIFYLIILKREPDQTGKFNIR